MLIMNSLSNDERIRVVAALVEGNSIRATSRMTGVARNTVTKLLVDLGEVCMKYHDEHVSNVRVRRLQCDEIWAYVGAKAKNVSAAKKEIGWGDVWTWVGIDAQTKLVVSYLVGGRGADWAQDFMQDCASRIQVAYRSPQTATRRILRQSKARLVWIAITLSFTRFTVRP